MILGLIGPEAAGVIWRRTSPPAATAISPASRIATAAGLPAWQGVGGKTGGQAPQGSQDYRRVLDDKSVDAVIVATPDHWHALATIRACQAGKDVYVEKPPSHNCWEGRKMIEAARKYNRIVQVGTQNRSAPYAMAARQYIADGKLGKVHFCRIYNQKEWPNFPHGSRTAIRPRGSTGTAGTDRPPRHTTTRPTIRTGITSGGTRAATSSTTASTRSTWLALCWASITRNRSTPPARASNPGAAESPDTQVAVYDFDDMVVTFELTLYTPYMLKISPLIRQATDKYPYWPQCATRIEIYGSEGLMYLGRHGGGWQVFGRPELQQGVVKDQLKGLFPDPEHKENFLPVRPVSRRRPMPTFWKGHRSVLWAHYATISYRLGGEKVAIDRKTEQIVDNPQAMKLFKREYRQPYEIAEVV